MAANLKANDVVQIFGKGRLLRVVGQLPDGRIALADPYMDSGEREYYGEGSLAKCESDHGIPYLPFRRPSVGTLRASGCHGKGGK